MDIRRDHVLVSGKATKYRLQEQPGQCVPTILATTCVGQNITRYLGQTEYVVEFAISQQPSIGGHQGATKLERCAPQGDAELMAEKQVLGLK